MGTARSSFNGTLVFFLQIYQEFVNPGMKQAITFAFYMKALVNRSNIGDSFQLSHELVSSEKTIPRKFIRIRMLVDWLSLGINSLNSVPLFVRVIEIRLNSYIIMSVKTIITLNPPKTVCIMWYSQASGRTLVTLVFFNDINSFKTDVQGVNRNKKLGRCAVTGISISRETHIQCRSPIRQSSHFFVFGSELFRKNHFKFNRFG